MLLVFLLQNGVHGSQDTASSWDPKNVLEQERLEEVANNSSRHDIAAYHAQNTTYDNDDDDDIYVNSQPPNQCPASPPPPPPSPPASPPPPPPPPPPLPARMPRPPVQRHSLGPMNLQCPDYQHQQEIY